MKSKSVDPYQRIINEVKKNKSFDFVKLYKSESATDEHIAASNFNKATVNMITNPQSELAATNRSRSPNKNNKRKKGNQTSDLSSIAGDHSSSGKATSNNSKNNMTLSDRDKSGSNVKSIMKNKLHTEESSNKSPVRTSNNKAKKRNKSVSFMLEDAEQVVIKKNKTNDSSKEEKRITKDGKNKDKLLTKKLDKPEKKIRTQKEDENLNGEDKNMTDKTKNKKDALRKAKKERTAVPTPLLHTSHSPEAPEEKVKKVKKFKPLPPDMVEASDDNTNTDQNSDSKLKKSKKKKRKAKSQEDIEKQEEGEPAIKSRRKELKPETIAVGLENLNIGDNPHTLSNLLDEMTVVDKNKRKKDRKMQKNSKLRKSDINDKSNGQKEAETNESERVKWENRKWNKGTKGESHKNKLLTSVVVDNLPINIMCSYKMQLSEHFAKCGTITGIGIAEAYANEDTKEVFTTTVYFQDEEAATKALHEDNMPFRGRRIRVRRPLPPILTTIVVRAFADMNDQAISSIFSSAGRIRNIRQLVKGKKSISTAFVEFDGPEAVERALKMAEDVKIGGKKMYLARYENRPQTKTKSTKAVENTENDGDNESE